MIFFAIFAADRDFIEQRRKSLRRFMVLVVRHPVLSDDSIVKYFLTFKGSVSDTFLSPLLV